MFLSVPAKMKTAAKAAVLILSLGSGVWLLSGSYSFGYLKAESKYVRILQEQKQARELAIAELEKEFLVRESAHINRAKEISDELEKVHKEHNQRISSIRADFASRLRLSESREGIYKRMSESGDLERERLASHAAELDRSLEEGRTLVRELGETLRQRDRELSLLGQQLLADRKLLEK